MRITNIGMLTKIFRRVILVLCAILMTLPGLSRESIQINKLSNIFDFIVLPGTGHEDQINLHIHALNDAGQINPLIHGEYNFNIGNQPQVISFSNGMASLAIEGGDVNIYLFHHKGLTERYKIYYISSGDAFPEVKHIPLWFSILPPLLAIALALLFKEVIISLFAGIWVGAFITHGLSLSSFFSGILRVMDTYVLQSLMDSGHLSIIVFSLMIGGMVAIISRNGGMMGIVNYLSRFATTARSTQLITWLMGILIFFDDYANTLIVGNTMRPVTDRFRISREKLAYIVDSTAAPVASIAFITTWIGAELGYIGDAIDNLGIDSNAYSMFLGSLQYAHYPIFTLVFVFFTIYLQKDYGSMYRSEQQAKLKSIESSRVHALTETIKDLEIKTGITPKWYNAFFPVLTVIITTIAGLFYTGFDNAVWQDNSLGLLNKLSMIIGNADSYKALLWSSLCGVLVALFLSLSTRMLTVKESMESLINGFKLLLPAVIILVSAWSLAILTEELHTATFLTHTLLGNLNPMLMPVLTFILAALIAFSTGSSWSTMAILYPILLPTTWALCNGANLDPDTGMQVMYHVVAVIMAGSVFGDHCSPISDTTILSSLATHCNHIDHVRTQLPYALTVGLVSILTGGLLFYLGVPWWLNYVIGISIMLAIINTFGKKVEG